MFNTLISVALGGALGASIRYLFTVGLYRLVGTTSFPVAILAVNVIGSFLMGVFVVAAAQRGLNHLSPFVTIGILGGFTTFSAFSLESVVLFERGATGLAVLYIFASVILSLMGLTAGLFVARSILL